MYTPNPNIWMSYFNVDKKKNKNAAKMEIGQRKMEMKVPSIKLTDCPKLRS